MNIDKLAADASKLSIPQLQQAMRDGTLPPYVGLPILQQKSQLAKQAQAAQAAGQPRPPTVAQQVDGEASQAQSVQDMMRQRALAMQGEMAGTGGLGSFVKEPEKKMALGGAVAFAGLNDSYVNPSLYGEDLNIDDATALSALSPEQKRYYASVPNGMEAAVAAGRNILAANKQPQRYRNVLPEGDITTDKTTNVPYFRSEVTPKLYSSDMPEMQPLTKRLIEEAKKREDVKPQRYRTTVPNGDITTAPTPYDIPAYTPTNVAPTAVTAPAQSTLNSQQLGAAPLTGAGSQILNANAQSDNRDMASRMQLSAPQTGNVQTSYGAVAPAPALPNRPADIGFNGSEFDKALSDKTSEEDYRKRMEDYLGPNTGIESLRGKLAKMEKESEDKRGNAGAMSALKFFTGLAAGKGYGGAAQESIADYIDAQKEFRKAQEKQFEIQSQLEAAQRRERSDIFKYGAESKRADQSNDRTVELQKASAENQFKIHQLDNQVQMRGQDINARAANRPTEASLASEYADAVQRGDTKRADAIKQSLELMNSYGSGRAYGMTENQAALVRQNAAKSVDAILAKDFSFRSKPPEEQERIRRTMIDNQINLVLNTAGGQTTLPPASGVQSFNDGFGAVQKH